MTIDQVRAECDKYEMKLIVLTHVHFDHAENAAELSRRYGSAGNLPRSWETQTGIRQAIRG